MRDSMKEFMALCVDNLSFPEPIYEFGALQTEGQEGFADIRPLFPGKQYIGTDFREGLGVDLTLDLHHIDLPEKSVGSAIVLDTLEHVEYPRKAMDELHRVIRPGGLVIISSVMRARIHSYPDDYWRFTPGGFKSLLKNFQHSFVSYAGDPLFPHAVVGIGFPGPAPSLEKLEQDLEAWQQRWNMINGKRKRPFLEKWARSFRKRLGKV
jgi:SAM-dependent methyltransferase